jgi:1-acyl-sn-glycerol-3-phosphate acyltransferase
MEIDQFWHILKTGYGYQSSRKCRFLVTKFPFWATFIYYIQLLNIILIESITARKGNYDRKTWARGSLGVLKIVESAGGRLHVSGLKGVAEHQEPLVYVANHMSLLDTLVLPCILLAFNRVTFVVKKGLL